MGKEATKEKQDKKKATLIFVCIALAWLAYTLLSHDTKEPVTKGIKLYSADMISAKAGEVQEFEWVINKGFPRANSELSATGSFKPYIVVKDSNTGEVSAFDAPGYSAFPFEIGKQKLNAFRDIKGGPGQIRIIVGFSPGEIENVVEGKKEAIIIQMLNSSDISNTVSLPYVVKNGAVDYGFLQHIESKE